MTAIVGAVLLAIALLLHLAKLSLGPLEVTYDVAQCTHIVRTGEAHLGAFEGEECRFLDLAREHLGVLGKVGVDRRGAGLLGTDDEEIRQRHLQKMIARR